MNMFSSHPNASLLSISLSAAVPLRILEYYDQGGITEADIAWVKTFGHTLGERADQLLFRSEKRGETAHLFNDLARSLAILSYVPGGVTIFGQCYEAGTVLAGFLGSDEAQAHLALVRTKDLEMELPIPFQEKPSGENPQ